LGTLAIFGLSQTLPLEPGMERASTIINETKALASGEIEMKHKARTKIQTQKAQPT